MQAFCDLAEADAQAAHRVAILDGCDPAADADVSPVGAFEAGVDGDAAGTRDRADTGIGIDRRPVECAAADQPVGERRGCEQQMPVAAQVALEPVKFGEHRGRLEQRRGSEAARNDHATAEAAAAEARAESLHLFLEDGETGNADRKRGVFGEAVRRLWAFRQASLACGECT